MSTENRTSAVTGIEPDTSGPLAGQEVVPPSETTPPRPDPRRWKALVVLCAAFFMVQLDAQIVLLALPSLQADLALSAGGAQWVMSSYLVTFGGLLLLGGRAADLLGRRRMFMVGMALFLLASLVAGIAWTGGMLIAGRVGQGVSAAIIAPTALSILMTTFTDGKELNKALAIWAANGAGGAMAALLIGGPITDGLGWEWIFFINIPVAVVLLAVSPKLLGESRDTAQRRSFDPLGAITITVAMVLFIYAVVETPMVGWISGQTIGMLAVTAVLIAIFIGIEKRAKAPLVPLEVFRSRNLVGGNVVMLLIGMVTFGAVLLVSLYAQTVLEFTALVFGLSTVIYTVMSVVGSQVGARVVAKLGFRTISVVATALMGISCLLLTQVSVDGAYFTDLFAGLLIFGFGLGLGFVAVSIAALTGVPDAHAGVASGINTAAFQLGGALGVAVAATVMVSAASGPDKAGLAEGHQAGFIAMTILAAVSVLVGLIMFKTPKPKEVGDAPSEDVH